MIEFREEKDIPKATIKVIGVGGAGGNAVDTMIEAGIKDVEFIAVNTDVKALYKCKAGEKIQIGEALTKGLGTGADPQLGQRCALEDKDRLRAAVEGADMVFIATGLGGGTGTGASPVIAQIAKDLNALTVAVVTKPFAFEGKPRAANAENGIKELKNIVDALIVVPNEKLLNVVDKTTSIKDAFEKANEVLKQGVQGISDLILGTGLIIVDFNDVKRIMSNAGSALMGIGIESGEDRAKRAAQKAISSQLLEETSIQGAKGILVNVSGGEGMTLHEVSEAMEIIRSTADENAEVIFGVLYDNSLDDKIKITVIATGFDSYRAEEYVNGVTGKDYASLDELLRDSFGPTSERRRARIPNRVLQSRFNSQDGMERDLEIPTFIRRNRNGSIGEG